jgi:hypothetical protein
VGFNSCSGSIGGESAGGVTGRGSGELLQPIMASHGDGHRHTPSLEAPGRIVGLFLNKEARITAAGQHRRPALTEGHRFRVGKDVGITPHGRSCAAGRPRSGVLQRLEVIADVERSSAGRAEGLRSIRGDVVFAAGAFEKRNRGHEDRISR